MLWVAFALISGCATMPKEAHELVVFPKDRVFIEKITDRLKDSKESYKPLGTVRTKVNFPVNGEDVEEAVLCKNYYNKGARNLLEEAQKVGADKVDDVASVVFYLDGKSALFKTPECTFDDEGGQILMQGRALKSFN